MGDAADMALDECMNFEDARTDFHTGEMDEAEAFERGIIDELGYEANWSTGRGGFAQTKTCRRCGSPGLVWDRHQGKWRLFQSGSSRLHECPVNPLKNNEKPGRGDFAQTKTCRCCGSSDLVWGRHQGKWRLFQSGSSQLHNCPVNPLKDNEK